MLPKKFRLTKNGSFSYVYRTGAVTGTKLISLTFVKSKGAPKIGFSVPNKVGKATVRNKLRRRMRAIIREQIRNIIPVQAVFSAKAGAALLSYDELKTLLSSLLIRSNILK